MFSVASGEFTEVAQIEERLRALYTPESPPNYFHA